MMRMVCPTAIRARFLPRRAASRRYWAARYVFFVLEATWAISTRICRSHRLPLRVFPLKRFFGGGARTDSGEEDAYEVIKRRLLEIIDQEDKSNPLSDEDLEKKLNEAGYPVKRRTVTKYRKMLDIPSSRQRKDWTVVPAAPTTPAPIAAPEPPPAPAPASAAERHSDAAPAQWR